MLRRLLRFFRRRKEPPLVWSDPDGPPSAGVREPRRPLPLAPGGATALELPDVSD